MARKQRKTTSDNKGICYSSCALHKKRFFPLNVYNILETQNSFIWIRNNHKKNDTFFYFCYVFPTGLHSIWKKIYNFLKFISDSLIIVNFNFLANKCMYIIILQFSIILKILCAVLLFESLWCFYRQAIHKQTIRNSLKKKISKLIFWIFFNPVSLWEVFECL